MSMEEEPTGAAAAGGRPKRLTAGQRPAWADPSHVPDPARIAAGMKGAATRAAVAGVTKGVAGLGVNAKPPAGWVAGAAALAPPAPINAYSQSGARWGTGIPGTPYGVSLMGAPAAAGEVSMGGMGGGYRRRKSRKSRKTHRKSHRKSHRKHRRTHRR